MDDLSPNLRLEAFWNCLDDRQKRVLMGIKSSALIEKQCCKYCQDLLHSSMQSLNKDANIVWHKLAKPDKHFLKIFVTPTGDFVPETSLGQFIEKDEVRACYSIDVTQGPNYRVHDEAANYIIRGTCKIVDPETSSSSGKKTKSKKGKGKKGGGKKKTNVSSGEKPSNSIVVKNQKYSDINSPENTVGNISKKLNTIAGEGGWEVGKGSCWYCRDKIYIRFIDLLTYPRPIRQFRMLLTKDIPLGELEAIIGNDVNRGYSSDEDEDGERNSSKVQSDSIVLLRKGKALVGKDKTLGELGLKRNTKLVISRNIVKTHSGDGNQDDYVVDSSEQERNRQFVGDLLFGQDPSEEHTGNSIVESFRLNYGYQILGLLIAKELSKNVVGAWQAEVSARQSQQDLLNDLLAEETQQTKKATKKQKRKERERKKKEEAQRKQKELEEAKAREKKRKEDMVKAKVRKEQEEKRRLEAEALKKEKEEQQRLWLLEKAQREKEEQARLEMEIQKERLRKKKLAENEKERMRVRGKEHRQRQSKERKKYWNDKPQQSNYQSTRRLDAMNRQHNQNQHNQRATSQQNTRRAYSNKNSRGVQPKVHESRAYEVSRNRMNASKDNMALDQRRHQHYGLVRQQQRAQGHNRHDYGYEQQQTVLQRTRNQQQHSNSIGTVNHSQNMVRNNFQQDIGSGRHRVNNLVQQQYQQQQQHIQFQGSNSMVNNIATSSGNINLDFYQSHNSDFGRSRPIGTNNAVMHNNDSNTMLNMQTWTNNHVSQTPSTSNLLGGFSAVNQNNNAGYPQPHLQRSQSLPVDRNHSSSALGMGGNHHPIMGNANSLPLSVGSWDDKISTRSMPGNAGMKISEPRPAVPGATAINNQVDYWNVDNRQPYNVSTTSSRSMNNTGGIQSNYNDNLSMSVSAPTTGMPQGHPNQLNRGENSLPEEVAASIFNNSSMFANAGSFAGQ